MLPTDFLVRPWTDLLANSAMGAWANGVPWAYLTYVVVMILAEAWLIGREMKWSVLKSLGRSLAANALSACVGVFCCAVVPFGTVQVSIGGVLQEPNPTLDILLVLLVGAVVSALVEQSAWMRDEERKRPALIWRTHLVLVPVGVIIFNLPERPYPYAEKLANLRHHAYRVRHLEDFAERAKIFGKVPPLSSTADLTSSAVGIEADPQLAFQATRFGRFAMRPDWIPFEVNRSAAGQKLNGNLPVKEAWIWIARSPRGTESPMVYWLNLSTLEITGRPGDHPPAP